MGMYHVDITATPLGVPETHIFPIPVNEPRITYVSVWFDERYLGVFGSRAIGIRLMDRDQVIAPLGQSVIETGTGPGVTVGVGNAPAYIWSKDFRVDWPENYVMRGPGYDLKLELFFETLPTVFPVRAQVTIVTAKR